jgi:hypothetical protein
MAANRFSGAVAYAEVYMGAVYRESVPVKLTI